MVKPKAKTTKTPKKKAAPKVAADGTVIVKKPRAKKTTAAKPKVHNSAC